MHKLEIETSLRSPVNPYVVPRIGPRRFSPLRASVGLCCCLYLVSVMLIGIGDLHLLLTLPLPPDHQVYWHEDQSRILPPEVRKYEWWFACEGWRTDNISTCGQECCNCAQIDAFRDYTSKAPFLEVHYPSRPGDAGQETLELAGWWLPAHPQWDSGAVVIVQHGMFGSINDFRPALIAYLVRAAGFSVLLTNLRGHGAAEAPLHGRMTWGYEYPLDLLGAWDFVVSDPQELLGGPRNASKVGLLGLSMGGHVAATAFGMEPRVPALWLDGAVWDPAELFFEWTRRYFGPFSRLTRVMLFRPAIWFAECLAGIDLSHNSPEKDLPNGPRRKRPVMLTHNKHDDIVDADLYIDLFKAHADRYELQTFTELGGICRAPDGGTVETHNVLQWLHPTEYRRRLCRFWSYALLGADCDESLLVPAEY